MRSPSKKNVGDMEKSFLVSSTSLTEWTTLSQIVPISLYIIIANNVMATHTITPHYENTNTHNLFIDFSKGMNNGV